MGETFGVGTEKTVFSKDGFPNQNPKPETQNGEMGAQTRVLNPAKYAELSEIREGEVR